MRSSIKPRTETTPELSVCGLIWDDSPRHARLTPSRVNLGEDLHGFLQHSATYSFPQNSRISQPTFSTTLSTVDDTATVSKPDQKRSRMNAGRNISVSSKTGDGPRSSQCVSCEDKADWSRSPDPPAASPCSTSSQSSSDFTGLSNISETQDGRLLSEIVSRLPCIQRGTANLASCQDIKEIFFPSCSSSDCNIVINALKLQLKYPHMPYCMHPCSRAEQMTFLQRHLHLVSVGTPLVDVAVFLKHRQSLAVMIETKHMATMDTRSSGCSITQLQHNQSDEEWIECYSSNEKKRVRNNLLPVILHTSEVGSMPGYCESPLEALVPLSMLPLSFPRHHRQLLLMATGFITGRNIRTVRRCSIKEARLLNAWHCKNKGSSYQLVTTGDLLVKWADVVLIVDPLVKHASRVSNNQQRQHQQRQQEQLQIGCRQISLSKTPESRSDNRGQETKTTPQHTVTSGMLDEQKGMIKTHTAADKWMPKIINCYSTAGNSKSNDGMSTLKTSAVEKKARPATPKRTETTVLDSESRKYELPICLDEVAHKGVTGQIAKQVFGHNEENVNSESSTERDYILQKVSPYDSLSSSWDSTYDFQMHMEDMESTKTSDKSLELTREETKSHSGRTEKVHPVRAHSLETVDSPSSSHNHLQRSTSVQPKPRACKVSRRGVRKSERIACQSKDVDTVNDDQIEVFHESKEWVDEDLSLSYSQTRSNQGFRKIATLFSILSQEEVSHLSKQDECNDSEKKEHHHSTTRPLGDISCMGLDLASKSNGLVLTKDPKAYASSPKKKSNGSTKLLENTNKYEDLVIEAQKSLIDSSPDRLNVKQNPVSVSEIMKNMDETFHAYKHDPVKLVQEKLKESQNQTGYVNMDFIRINHPDEGTDVKHSTLTPLERYEIRCSKKKDVLNGLDISSILRNNGAEKNFSLLGKTQSSQTKKQDQPKKSVCFTTELPCNRRCQQTIRNPQKDNNRLPSHPVPKSKDTPRCVDQSSIKPTWDIEKVIQGSKLEPKQRPSHEKRKERMNADFVAMKEKAIAKSENKLPTGVVTEAGLVSLSQQNTSSLPETKKENPDTVSSQAMPKSPVCQGNNDKETYRDISNAFNICSFVDDKAKDGSAKQLKKRPRLASSLETEDVSSKTLNRSISAYWSHFPTGQRKDCLTNHRFGNSRYPIDFYKPPTLATSKRGKSRKACTIQSTNHLTTSTELSPGASYITWNTHSGIPLVNANLAHINPSSTNTLGVREKTLHSRSLSAESFQRDIGSERKVPSSNSTFYKDSVLSCDSTKQSTLPTTSQKSDNAQLRRVPNRYQFQGSGSAVSPIRCAQRGSGPQQRNNYKGMFLPLANTVIKSGDETPSAIVVNPTGPFYDQACLHAGFNVQRIRRLSGQLGIRNETNTRRSLTDSRPKEPLQLANGEYMIWNEVHGMWCMDKNKNKNKNNNNYLPPEDKQHTEGTCRNALVSNKREKKKMITSDINDLLTNTIDYLLSRAASHASLNSNCNNSNGDTNETSNEEQGDTERINFKQPVYPSYGAMIKGEPIKKNILLRETLKDNFFLNKEISLCVCTCRDALQLSRPGKKMHFKKYFKKKHLDSLRNCPLHDEEQQRLQNYEIFNILVMINSDVNVNEMNQLNKNSERKKEHCGHISVGLWFHQHEKTNVRSRSVGKKCLFSAAIEYLGPYSDQHYKKELLARYETDTMENTDSDHLYKKFFSFMRKYSQKVRNIEAQASEGSKTCVRAESETVSQVDRELRRQLKDKSGTIIQQELFMKILKKTQKKDCKSSRAKSEAGSDRQQEQAHTESGRVKSHINFQQAHESESVVTGSCEAGNQLSSSNIKAQQPKPAAVEEIICTYDEHFSNKTSDISYHGLAYIRGLALPYVVDNGYKYVHVKMASCLLPRCCCSLVKSLLKKHPSLRRSLCTWEQISLLDSLSTRRPKMVIRTGDVLVRLDTLLANLSQLEEELNMKHQLKKPRRCTCLY